MADLIQYEKNLYSKGYRLIAGIDEVGRGPLAGPFVVGAVILDLEKVFDALHREHTNNDVASRKVLGYKDINDSKKVSGKKRSILSEFITKEAIAYSIIEISPEQIDKDGLSKVTQIAFYNAVKKLNIKPDFVLTDAFEIKKLTKYTHIRSVGVYGGTNINPQKQLVYDGMDILVATPGRLMDLAFCNVLRLKAVHKLVIDEVDEMLDLGFRSQLINLIEKLPLKRQNLMFSATMTDDVENLITNTFNHPMKIEVAAHGTPIDKIIQKAYHVPNANTKLNLLKIGRMVNLQNGGLFIEI